MAIPRVFCRSRLLVNKDFSLVFRNVSLKNCLVLSSNFQVHLVRHFRTPIMGYDGVDKNKQLECEPSSSSSDDSDSDEDDLVVKPRISPQNLETTPHKENFITNILDVTVEYHRGLPQVTVPLPSRRERCVFTLKPISNTVGDFLEMLKKEDKGIDTAICRSIDDIRIASSNTIETLLEDDFKLVINDKTYNVSCPKQERLTGEEIKRLADIKNMVHQLYEVLNIEEHNVLKENEIVREIENVKQELLPFENQIRDLEVIAEKRGNWLSWAGLGFMSVQFGILARLTWWEYSWDIMEPVTYFVTYGTAMAMYSYYVLTKEEYILPSVTDRQKLLVLHNKAKKMGLDLQRYNQLQEQLVKLNRRLAKLRNPLKVPPKSRSTSTPSETSSDDVSQITLDNFAKTLGKIHDNRTPIPSQK
ncbi:calcium uniporter protein, mitochondrial isoform X1 [Coccinella septempunctata]|uniref:calcium uniporter protein, mitochondrial isoform X1 n=1 Tax=Coccinella septempunctata TaxID=41139 RepID=UPI001D08ED80|nr:calcium uniporter protein, mitochondrial isoform X1 [Coccinella septempunctata]